MSFATSEGEKRVNSLAGDEKLIENEKHDSLLSSIDQIVGFTEARRRAEHPEEFETPEEPPHVQHRVFVNHVDGFNTKYISQFLSTQMFGASGEDEEEEEAADEELESEEEVKKKEPKPPLQKFEIIGTVFDNIKSNTTKFDYIKEIVNVDDSYFFEKIWKCGFIVYDITNDVNQIQEAQWVLQSIEKRIHKWMEDTPKEYEESKELRIFILISTIMTWAKTKPIDPDDPETPFVETDYRKRKPHPNYKDHITLEKQVVEIGKKFKKKFKTIVVASGITYGMEEEDLHSDFRLAWEGEPELPIFDKGNNVIPLIHVKDLASVVSALIIKGPKRPYILAIEQSPSKLKQIIKGLAKTMGNGRVKVVPKEQAFLYQYITQDVFERITVNLIMEPSYILETLEVQFKSDLNLSENIPAICKEYKNARSLRSVKLMIHGPPAVGKTKVAQILSSFYKIHYINIKTIVDEAVQDIKNEIQRIKEAEKAKEEKEAAGGGDEAEEDEDDEEDEAEGIEELEERLAEIETGLLSEKGKLEDELLIGLFKKKLASNACQNKGYVIDSFPKTIDQAIVLFEPGDDEEDEEARGEEEAEEEEKEEPTYNKKLMPELIVSLEATNEFLCNRVMNVPEKDIQGTRYAEEPMLRRLALFRELNSEESTVLDYFDELEIHPMIINTMDDDPEMSETVKKIVDKIGEPRNYGKSPEEIAEEERILAERLEQKLLRQQKEQEELEARLLEEHELKLEEWSDLMASLKKEEEEIMAAQGETLRNYLIKFVFPTLTRGLLEVAKIRPNDPVDFLAEYLFKENPEGKMFDPAYTSLVQDLLQAVEDLQDNIRSSSIDKDFL